MSMAPRAEEELINATFSGLANLESELNDTFSQEEGTARLSALSMGMTEGLASGVALWLYHSEDWACYFQRFVRKRVRQPLYLFD